MGQIKAAVKACRSETNSPHRKQRSTVDMSKINPNHKEDFNRLLDRMTDSGHATEKDCG